MMQRLLVLPVALVVLAFGTGCSSTPRPEALAAASYGMDRREVAAATGLPSEEQYWVDAEGARWIVDRVEFGSGRRPWSLLSRDGALVAVLPRQVPGPPRNVERFQLRVAEWMAERPALTPDALAALSDDGRARRANTALRAEHAIGLVFSAPLFALAPVAWLGAQLETENPSERAHLVTVAAARELPVRATRTIVLERLGPPTCRVATPARLERWWYESAREGRHAPSVIVTFDGEGVLWVDPSGGPAPKLEPTEQVTPFVRFALAGFAYGVTVALLGVR